MNQQFHDGLTCTAYAGPFLEAVETTFGRRRAKEAALVPPRLGTPPQIHDRDPHATDRR